MFKSTSYDWTFDYRVDNFQSKKPRLKTVMRASKEIAADIHKRGRRHGREEDEKVPEG